MIVTVIFIHLFFYSSQAHIHTHTHTHRAAQVIIRRVLDKLTWDVTFERHVLRILTGRWIFIGFRRAPLDVYVSIKYVHGCRLKLDSTPWNSMLRRIPFASPWKLNYDISYTLITGEMCRASAAVFSRSNELFVSRGDNNVSTMQGQW